MNVKDLTIEELDREIDRLRSMQQAAEYGELVAERTRRQDQAAEREVAIQELAKGLHHSEGDLEFDDDATVSEGSDNGAYVQCWKWIDFTDTEFDKEKKE